MRALLLSAVASAALLAAPALAQQAPAASASDIPVTITNVGANINISPKRVYFEPSRRNTSIFIINQGDQPVTVDVGLADRVMLPDGAILATDEAQKRDEGKAAVERLQSASKLIQISPRRITLQPGRGQTVRLRLAELPAADQAKELRAHVTVTTLPPPDTGTTAQAAAGAGDANELRFNITTVYGISIPAIVRTGPADVQAGVENARVEVMEISRDGRSAPERTPVLVAEIVRKGGNSLFGNLEVWGAKQAKTEAPLGSARGVGVYTEVDRRVVYLPLSRAPAAGEQLSVTFTDDDTSPGKVLASSVL